MRIVRPKSPEPTAGWRGQFRCRGSRRESAVVQLSTSGDLQARLSYDHD